VFLARPSVRAARERDTVLQLETNLDDMNPQMYEYVMEQLFACGALDVTLAPVIMKRGRPGIVLTCLAAPAQLDQILDVLFEETTTLGIRIREGVRQILSRRFISVKVRGGVVRMKVADVNATTAKAAPEYLDCKRIAERTGRPVKRVLEDAALAYAKQREARPSGQR
jgi:pyridinium-3,5-bisthiocarboxylic acid mononucleotide nickel chelatase